MVRLIEKLLSGQYRHARSERGSFAAEKKKLSPRENEQVKEAAQRAVREYGKTFEKLGNE